MRLSWWILDTCQQQLMFSWLISTCYHPISKRLQYSHWLVVLTCFNHLDKYESQWEGWHPIYCGKSKMFETTNQLKYLTSRLTQWLNTFGTTFPNGSVWTNRMESDTRHSSGLKHGRSHCWPGAGKMFFVPFFFWFKPCLITNRIHVCYTW